MPKDKNNDEPIAVKKRKQKQNTVNAGNRKTMKGDSSPLVSLRRAVVSNLYCLQGMTPTAIHQTFCTDPEYVMYWQQDQEGKPLKPPSLSTIERDCKALVKGFKETQLGNYEFKVNLIDAQLQMVKQEAAKKEDWGSYLSAVNIEIKLHGLEPPKNVNLITDQVRRQLDHAVARVSATFKHDPELHNRIIRALMGKDIESAN